MCVCDCNVFAQVAVIREGMSCVIPVPLFSLYTAKMLEHAICGREQVDLSMLKKVVRFGERQVAENNGGGHSSSSGSSNGSIS